MKSIKKQKHIKQITYIIILLMLCNFIFPNYSYAVSTASGGSLLDIIAKFLCFVPDAVNDFLQSMFVSSQKIQVLNGRYKILYSSGTIFAGEIPALDINFIDPMPKQEITTNTNPYYIVLDDITTEYISDVFDRLNENEKETQHVITGFFYTMEDVYEEIYNKYDYYSRDYGGDVFSYAITYDDWLEESLVDETYDLIFGIDKYNEFWICGNTMYFIVDYVSWYVGFYHIDYAVFSTTLTDDELQAIIDGDWTSSLSTSSVSEYKESSSGILQPIIATWYNVLRRIALVGLLSVLVYLGIRIVLSSTSAQDKAKYKKMLKDWLIALCILFTLHYIMNITITVIDNISEIFSVSVVGEDGEDVLITAVRNEIANSENWSVAITYVIIYCVLTVYTVIFTIQYLRRVIYLAFLTVIAPLIALTYPLDKIKDSKAQAFDMWMKDYIFFSLIQVLHLLLYYIFVGSAIDLNNKGNWLYAIVAIGFLTKAEKLMKKMFGFEKSKSMGALAAGATGALVMNVINKVPRGAPKGAGGGSQGGSSSGKGVRTATKDPISALQGGTSILGSGDSQTGGSPSGGSPEGGSPAGGSPEGGLPAGGSQTGGSPAGGSSSGSSPAGGSPAGGSPAGGRTKPKRNIGNGVKSLAGRYLGTGVKNLAKGLVAAPGAVIGFSAGVAQGDISSAIGGAFVGGKAAAGLVDWGTNKVSGMGRTFREVGDTFNEGAYGKEVAQNMKFDREFRRSKEYKKLKSNPNFSDDDIQKMLDAGITDSKKMDKILKKNAKDPKKYTIDKAIAYSAMAETCPEGILYNNSKFIRYCHDKDILISPEELQELRKNIVEFK